MTNSTNIKLIPIRVLPEWLITLQNDLQTNNYTPPVEVIHIIYEAILNSNKDVDEAIRWIEDETAEYLISNYDPINLAAAIEFLKYYRTTK